MKKIVFFLSAFLAVSPQILFAQTGSLDDSFGTAGKVITVIDTNADYGRAIAIQTDGKILAAGWAKIGTANQFALCRYKTNGTLDSTFNSNGIVTTAVGASDGSTGMAIQTDGKIILAGYSFNTTMDFAVVRYNTDGTLDNTFSGDGMVTTPVGTGVDVGSCMALQADGKIIVGGKVNNGTNLDFGMVRYNSDGTLDAGFGTAGKVITVFPGGATDPNAITLQTDGKILMVGKWSSSSCDSFAIARYNIDGTLDNTFSSDGRLTIGFGIIGSNSDYATSVIMQPDGKILIGGKASVGTGGDFAMARLNTDGTMDAGFGTGGKVTTDFAGDNDYIHSLVLQPDGKIIAGGSCYPGITFLEFALARYNTDGTLDAGFGTSGKIVTEMGTGTNEIQAMALQTDAKLVVVGTVNSGTTADFALARYYTTPGVGDLDFPASINTEKVYPNPVTTNVTLEYSLINNEEISIFLIDIQGRIISTYAEKEKQSIGEYSRSLIMPTGLPTGYYSLILLSKCGQKSFKLEISNK